MEFLLYATQAMDIVFISLLIVAAISDIRTRTIPDTPWIVMLIMAIVKNTLLAIYQSNSQPISGMFIGFIIIMPLIFVGISSKSIGGGDFKLLMAVSIYITFPNILGALLIMAMTGLIQVSLSKIYCRATSRPISRRIAFAPAIAIGSISLLLFLFIQANPDITL